MYVTEFVSLLTTRRHSTLTAPLSATGEQSEGLQREPIQSTFALSNWKASSTKKRPFDYQAERDACHRPGRSTGSTSGAIPELIHSAGQEHASPTDHRVGRLGRLPSATSRRSVVHRRRTDAYPANASFWAVSSAFGVPSFGPRSRRRQRRRRPPLGSLTQMRRGRPRAVSQERVRIALSTG